MKEYTEVFNDGPHVMGCGEVESAIEDMRKALLS
jgi:hypothetical protein